MNQSPSLGDSDSNSLAGNVPHEIRRICCRIMLLFCCLSFCLFVCLFHQRCSKASFSNKIESFCVTRSWSNNLSRRYKGHREHSK